MARSNFIRLCSVRIKVVGLGGVDQRGTRMVRDAWLGLISFVMPIPDAKSWQIAEAPDF